MALLSGFARWELLRDYAVTMTAKDSNVRDSNRNKDEEGNVNIEREGGEGADGEQESGGSGSSSNNNNGEAAGGVVRGVGRSIVRGAPIGRLPHQAANATVAGGKVVGKAATRGGPSSILTRQKLPVRRVAKISDRVSTGLDWLNMASEETTTKDKWITRIGRFGLTLFKNTLLGIAVFESYGYVISEYVESIDAKQEDDKDIDLLVSAPPALEFDHIKDTEDDEEIAIAIAASEPDEYEKAPLPIHFGAGVVAGTLHGLFSSVMDGQMSAAVKPYRYLCFNTIHHSIAHSMLFGSYESIKRGCLQQIHSIDNETLHYGNAYLFAFAISGGLAGQIQHCVSHYMEYWLGLTNGSLAIHRSSLLLSPPALRPLLWAFPPSAIGFVAFEYGKKFSD